MLLTLLLSFSDVEFDVFLIVTATLGRPHRKSNVSP